MNPNSNNNTNNNGNRGPFLTMTFGNTPNGTYAFHVEGFVGTRGIYFKPAADGKKAFMSFSMSVGRNAWLMLGKENERPETNWINVAVFGDLAENLNGKISASSKVVVCGKVVEETYNGANGAGSNVRVNADNIYPLACRVSEGGEPARVVTHSVNNFVGRDGTPRSSNMATLVAGTVKAVDAVKEIKGQFVVSFDLDLPMSGQRMAAIAMGNYNKDANYGDYSTVKCNVWGPKAQRLDRVLTVGNTLVVTGIPSVREYSGREYVNLNVRDLSVMRWATPANNGASAQNRAPAQNNAPAQNRGYQNAQPTQNYQRSAQNYRPAAQPQNPEYTPSDFQSFMDNDDDFDLPF